MQACSPDSNPQRVALAERADAGDRDPASGDSRRQDAAEIDRHVFLQALNDDLENAEITSLMARVVRLSRLSQTDAPATLLPPGGNNAPKEYFNSGHFEVRQSILYHMTDKK